MSVTLSVSPIEEVRVMYPLRSKCGFVNRVSRPTPGDTRHVALSRGLDRTDTRPLPRLHFLWFRSHFSLHTLTYDHHTPRTRTSRTGQKDSRTVNETLMRVNELEKRRVKGSSILRSLYLSRIGEYPNNTTN